MFSSRCVGILSVLALVLLAALPAVANPLPVDAGTVVGDMQMGEEGYCNGDGTAAITPSEFLNPLNYDEPVIYSWQDAILTSLQFGTGELDMCGWMTERQELGGCTPNRGVDGRGRIIFRNDFGDPSDDVILYVSDFGWEVNADLYYVATGSVATTGDKAANSEGSTITMVFRRGDTYRCHPNVGMTAEWTVTPSSQVDPNSLPGI